MEQETPPRAWRRLTISINKNAQGRNTSTGVEKTVQVYLQLEGGRKHLHGRGEDGVYERADPR